MGTTIHWHDLNYATEEFGPPVTSAVVTGPGHLFASLRLDNGLTLLYTDPDRLVALSAAAARAAVELRKAQEGS